MTEQFIRRIGNDLFIGGLILSNGNELYIVPLPDEFENADSIVPDEFPGAVIDTRNGVFEAIIKQTDLMEVEIADPKDPLKKILVRKCQRQLDTNVSWQCFRRDGFKCRYCGRDDVPLSYDHVITWETGGANTVENGITACKKCNKTRGNTVYGEWLRSDYYLAVSQGLENGVHEENLRVLARLESGEIEKARTKRNR